MTSFLFSDGGIKKTANVESSEPKNEPVAYINYVEGTVYLNFEEAQINMILMSADELKTENGRIEIKMDQGYLRLDRYTSIVFVVLEEGMKTIRIKHGNVYFRIEGEIAIQTPHKQDILKSDLYRIDVNRRTNVYSNPRVVDDDFDRFHHKRENELNRRTKQEYLPEELADYESTLYRYGSWRHYDPYGYVWIPYVRHGWRPYLYGRWVYYPYYGWTWVSYEPFGWTTFHYGRWHWHSIWGWYWIPTRYWGPSWVHWYTYGDYIGWCPMGYNYNYYQYYWDDYYGHSYSRAWTVIRKDQLRNKNVAKHVISKIELKKRIPREIRKDQLEKRLDSQKVLNKKEYQKLERRIVKGKTIGKEAQRSETERRRIKRSERSQEEKRKRTTKEKRVTKKQDKKKVSKKSSSKPSKKSTSNKKSSSSKSSGKVKKKK